MWRLAAAAEMGEGERPAARRATTRTRRAQTSHATLPRERAEHRGSTVCRTVIELHRSRLPQHARDCPVRSSALPFCRPHRAAGTRRWTQDHRLIRGYPVQPSRFVTDFTRHKHLVCIDRNEEEVNEGEWITEYQRVRKKTKRPDYILMLSRSSKVPRVSSLHGVGSPFILFVPCWSV